MTGLVLLSILLPTGSVHAEPSVARAAAKPDYLTAPDVPSALSAARREGKRVEALSERTETSTTWVHGDGSLTTELTAGPIRFERDGRWEPVDTDLAERADGSVAPKAHPGGLTLSGGGGKVAGSLAAARTAAPRDLVTLGEGDQQVTLQWKGGLPEPRLDGNRAEYPEAVPGADVIVEATRTGFEQYVAIKKRPAATDYRYTLPLRAEGLAVKQQPDGSVLFTDRRTGQERAVMPAPMMWDATVDERSGEHTRRVPVGMDVVVKDDDSFDLVVTPDAGFLADPKTRYPVTVDPSTSALSNVFDTYVQQGETRDWSTDTEIDLGNPGTKNANGTPRTARSYITWGTAPIADALVSSAQLSLWNFHSANTDCKAQAWEVWSADPATTASRWTKQPAMHTKHATSTQTKGNPACGGAGWVSADVTSLAQNWASAKAPQSSMGLRAADESAVAPWKRFSSANATSNPPKLTVTYNFRPRSGNNRQAGPPYAPDASGTWQVSTTTPTLRDTFSDKDGDKINGTFEVVEAATGKRVGDYLVSPFVESGRAAAVTLPDGLLKDGTTYRFRTSPYDGTHYNLAWSPWTTFTVGTGARPGALPDMPQALEQGATDTLTPLLSGVVTSPAQGRIRAEFALRDENGKDLSAVHVPDAWVDSGLRAAAQVPAGALRSGTTYLWAMRACTDAGCSAWSYEQELTAREGPGLKAPVTRTLPLSGDALADATAAVRETTPAVKGAQLTLDADHAVWLSPDLTKVPAGARITGAQLELTPVRGAERPLEVYELLEPWAAPQKGADLPGLLDEAPFADAARLADQDLAPVVQSWLEQDSAEGLALRLPKGAKDSVVYHSGRAKDAAQRPRLVIDYVPAAAPGRPQDVRATSGHGGLLTTWNPPQDNGAAGEGLEYTVAVQKENGTEAARLTTALPYAVVSGLTDGATYRVSVQARTAHGTSPAATSEPVTTASVPGGAAVYREIVQQYLNARAGLLTGGYPTAAAALAASSRGASFADLLNAQAPGLVESRELLARHGRTYSDATAQLSDVLVGVDTDGAVFLRASVTESASLNLDGTSESDEGRGEQRFTFSTNGGAPILHLEADAPAAETVLTETPSAWTGLDVAPPQDQNAEEVPDEPIDLGSDGFPVDEAAGPVPVALRAAAVVGSGTAKWATKNIGTKSEYQQDCTNFVSKALYYGGKMKTRSGGRKHDRAWWQQYYLFGSIKNKSYTWSGAENFRRHMTKYRKAPSVSKKNARPGDIVMFKWKKEKVYNHAAVVVGNSGRDLQLRQHGGPSRTTLSAAIARYKRKSNYIERVIILRPRSRG
ncbi:DNRLRE domain-containing protein [Streptomyces sp. SID8374]|nr:DNRLRE domain-containing protein [Streptomyces sp. SID8374]